MSKDIVLHQIKDWSKIVEKEAFWGEIDLFQPEMNFGIHRYNDGLWTSGLVGVGRVFDKDNKPIQENGREHILIIESSYGLNPWKMLEEVMMDDEYDSYINELSNDGRYLYQIFYNQPLIKIPNNVDIKAEILFAISYINACYYLCKKGLKKSLIYHEENFTAKVRGKIDVNKNIKQNIARGRTEKFYCKYVDFTEDTIENRAIKKTLIKSDKILKTKFREDSSIKGKISFCLNCFRHVKTVNISKSDFDNAKIGGFYSYYKPVLQLARALTELFHKGYTNIGIKKEYYTIPYSINMETLFEYYARIQLKKALATTEYRVGKYSNKLFLQEGVNNTNNTEKGIHLIPFCIPDIIIYQNDKPAVVIDVKYKLNGKSNRADSHQLLAYVLLTGANRCGFILPGEKTEVKEMETSGNNFLPLAPHLLRYYELLLGTKGDEKELLKVLL